MGKRGPKPVDLNELAFWEGEWYAFFTGLCVGFPAVDLEGPELTPKLKLPSHPILLRELERTPISQRPLKTARTLRRTLRSVLPERKLCQKLLKVKSIPQIRKACRRSRYWQDRKRRQRTPAHGGFFLARLKDLHKHADQFLASKNDSHYPRSARHSSEEKRLRYLARAMAGVTMGVSPRTAIDLLAKRWRGMLARADRHAESSP